MKEEKVSRFRNQYSEPIGDFESVCGESPVVSGQSLSGAELFRRQSSGLPVGCAVRQFNQVNPYLEKFSVYDSIAEFRIRHGMLTPDQVNERPSSAPDAAPNPAVASGNEPSSND